jgi:hypothetical protein
MEDGVLRCEETSGQYHYSLNINVSGDELDGEYTTQSNDGWWQRSSLKASCTN